MRIRTGLAQSLELDVNRILRMNDIRKKLREHFFPKKKKNNVGEISSQTFSEFLAATYNIKPEEMRETEVSMDNITPIVVIDLNDKDEDDEDGK
jgi:hypothetical protein